VSVGSGSTSGWFHVEGGDSRGWPQGVGEWAISTGQTDRLDRDQRVREHLNHSLTSHPSHPRLDSSLARFHVDGLHLGPSPPWDARRRQR
jgi:hypothetical protein